MSTTDIPKNCRECGLDATTCKASYYGGSMCKHEKAIVAKTLASPFYKSNGGEKK